MSGNDSIELIRFYFPVLSDEKIQKLIYLGKLYTEWNKKINIISKQDIGYVFHHHILHSLAFLKVANLMPGERVLDVGTGGGLPGLPLAICFPETEFHLVDGTGKKIMVVNEIVKELKLKNVRAEAKRVEDIKKKYAVITGRAVAKLESFSDLVIGNLLPSKSKEDGIYYWSGSGQKITSGDRKLVLEEYMLKKIFDLEYYRDKSIFRINISI